MLTRTLRNTVALSLTLAPALARADAPAPPAAVESAAPDTVIGRSSLGVSGVWIAPSYASTSLDGKLGFAPGLRGGVTFGRRFSIGVAADLLLGGDAKITHDDVRQVGGTGGVLLQYVLGSTRIVHGTFDAVIGNGGYCVQGKTDDCAIHRFAFVEPSANLEINLHRNVRLSTGVGYRRALLRANAEIDSDALSGLVLRSSVVIGKF